MQSQSPQTLPVSVRARHSRPVDPVLRAHLRAVQFNDHCHPFLGVSMGPLRLIYVESHTGRPGARTQQQHALGTTITQVAAAARASARARHYSASDEKRYDKTAHITCNACARLCAKVFFNCLPLPYGGCPGCQCAIRKSYLVLMVIAH